MVAIVVFHILMLLLALGVGIEIIPAQRVSTALGYLHNSIGITTPAEQQVRMVALIWIGSVVFIVDGCLLLLLFITKLVHAG
jgi:hypothetical protein